MSSFERSKMVEIMRRLFWRTHPEMSFPAKIQLLRRAAAWASEEGSLGLSRGDIDLMLAEALGG